MESLCTEASQSHVINQVITPFRYETALESMSCLKKIAIQLHISQIAVATAQIFYHKFVTSLRQDVDNVPMVTSTCLFLASKVVERPVSLNSIVKAYSIIDRRVKTA